MSNGDSSKQTGGERSSKRKDPFSSATSVTMELEVLDCPVCYGPLQPPIFQCALGHLICSSYCGKLQKPKKRHHCSRGIDYNRCYGVEKIIESIQVPCFNTKYGCSVKTSYYEKEDHETKCRYTPCFCPHTSCSFSASTGLLQEHFTTEHHWPSTKCSYGWCFYANVKERIHVISSEDEQLFLLKIASEPFCCVIAVFSVQPHDTGQKFRCTASQLTSGSEDASSEDQAGGETVGTSKTAKKAEAVSSSGSAGRGKPKRGVKPNPKYFGLEWIA